MEKSRKSTVAGNIDAAARRLHAQWLRQNEDFVRKCRDAPGIYNCSRDFDRVVSWQKLPYAWKEYYRREARYALLLKQQG